MKALIKRHFFSRQDIVVYEALLSTVFLGHCRPSDKKSSHSPFSLCRFLFAPSSRVTFQQLQLSAICRANFLPFFECPLRRRLFGHFKHYTLSEERWTEHCAQAQAHTFALAPTDHWSSQWLAHSFTHFPTHTHSHRLVSDQHLNRCATNFILQTVTTFFRG